VLLKAAGYTSQQVATILNTNEISVHNWLKRYAEEGIAGLQTRKGQGWKPILEQEHLSIVRAAIEQERQRLSQAQQIIEQNIGKKMSRETLTRFLKLIPLLLQENKKTSKR